MSARLTILCLASYHKGIELLRELRRQDCTVLLPTGAAVGPREVETVASVVRTAMAHASSVCARVALST